MTRKVLQTVALLLLSVVVLQAKNQVKLITTKPLGSKFTFYVKAPVGTTITMGGLKDGSMTVTSDGTTITSYTTNTDIYIKGDILSLSCSAQQLKEVSISAHPTLESLNVTRNQIDRIYVAGCDKLTFINCMNNNISSGNMDRLIRSLKEKSPSKYGTLVISETPKPDKDHWTDHDIWLAESRKWKLCWYNMGVTTTTYDRITPTQTMAVSFVSTAIGQEARIRGEVSGPFTSEGHYVPSLQQNWSNLYINEKYGTWFGKVSRLEIDGNGFLSSFSAAGHEYLRELSLTNGVMTSLNVGTIKNLRELRIYHNQITGAKMSELINKLPNRKRQTPGTLFLTSEEGEEGNSYTQRDATRAKELNWIIRKMDVQGREVEDGATIELVTGRTTGNLFLGMRYQSHFDIYGAKENGTQNEYTTYGLTSSNVRILGDITDVKADRAENELSVVRVLNHTSLQTLDIQNNKITSLDVTGCIGLVQIRCYGNMLRGSAMTDFIRTLPVRTSKDGKLYLTSDEDTETNSYNADDIALALERGWTVFTKNETEVKADELPVVSLVTEREAGEEVSFLTEYVGTLDVTGLEAVPNNAVEYQTSTLTASDLRFTGKLEKFGCGNNNVTSLTFSRIPTLVVLDVADNQLTALDVTACSGLNEVRCSGNMLRGTAMTDFIRTLPVRTSKNGKLYLSSGDENETNGYSSSDVALAMERGWTAFIKNGIEIRADELPEITFQTERTAGASVALLTKFAGTLNIWGLDGELTSGKTYQTIVLTDAKPVITGRMEQFGCHENDITALSCLAHPTLRELYVENNKIVALDVTASDALRKITAEGNLLKGEAMSNFLATLPDLTAKGDTERGELRLFKTFKGENETNEITAEQVQAANAKGWHVTDDEQEITAEMLSAELIVREAAEHDASVYTMEGIRLSIPAEQLPEGTYIIGDKVRIVTHK